MSTSTYLVVTWIATPIAAYLVGWVLGRTVALRMHRQRIALPNARALRASHRH